MINISILRIYIECPDFSKFFLTTKNPKIILNKKTISTQEKKNVDIKWDEPIKKCLALSVEG